MSTVRLTAGTDVTRQAVTKHLQVLASAGIVRDFHRGRERVWELELEQLSEARHYLDAISRRWDTVLARLKAAVETDPTSQLSRD